MWPLLWWDGSASGTEQRRIHYLSSPPESSVNDHIPAEWGALEHTSFDEAIALVAASGQGSTLIKRDLTDAFRHILVALQDQWLLGYFCYTPHTAQPRAITLHSHSEWRSSSANHRLRHTTSRMNHRGCLGGGCRLRSNPKDRTICLAEDDHQLQNPKPVSPRTITNYRTRDLSHRGQSQDTRRLLRHVSPKTVVG